MSKILQTIIQFLYTLPKKYFLHEHESSQNCKKLDYINQNIIYVNALFHAVKICLNSNELCEFVIKQRTNCVV